EPAAAEPAESQDHAVQELPLNENADRPPAKAATRKSPAGKRAAAAITETAAQSVVAVPPSESSGSMPPTDLDVVDMVVDLRALDEDAARQPAPIGSPPAPPGGPPAS
ncbi:MAG: hypothetical protein AB1679_28970, partial [Actinomycetota bacterium]